MTDNQGRRDGRQRGRGGRSRGRGDSGTAGDRNHRDEEQRSGNLTSTSALPKEDSSSLMLQVMWSTPETW